MDAHDRTRVLRHLMDVELHERKDDRSELSLRPRILLEPIEDNERQARDESAVLLVPAGRSWGP